MRLRFASVLVLAAALTIDACGSSSSSSSSSSSGAGSSSSGAGSSSRPTPLGFEGTSLHQGAELAPAHSTQPGAVDGISCAATEQLAYHIHAHLAVYIAGSPRALPAGIGIPGSVTEQTGEGPVAAGGQCIYWLHTHTSDGVIHVESPTTRLYTLGEFFDEWRQPLSPTRVADAGGKVTAYVDGKLWTKDPRAIPLEPHAVIQLDVGSPAAAFQPVSWDGTRL